MQSRDNNIWYMEEGLARGEGGREARTCGAYLSLASQPPRETLGIPVPGAHWRKCGTIIKTNL